MHIWYNQSDIAWLVSARCYGSGFSACLYLFPCISCLPGSCYEHWDTISTHQNWHHKMVLTNSKSFWKIWLLAKKSISLVKLFFASTSRISVELVQYSEIVFHVRMWRNGSLVISSQPLKKILAISFLFWWGRISATFVSFLITGIWGLSEISAEIQ